MSRIAIIGNAAGGKSTLARKLSELLGIKTHHLDRLQWNPGWVPTPSDVFAREHRRILEDETWIIDGFAGWDSIETRLDVADAVIFVDLPLVTHYWWALKRQIKFALIRNHKPHPDFPDGCPMLPMTWVLAKMIWNIHRFMRPKLLERIGTLAEDTLVIHIRSRKDIRVFIRDVEDGKYNDRAA